MKRTLLMVGALCCGFMIAALWPQLTNSIRSKLFGRDLGPIARANPESGEANSKKPEAAGKPAIVKLTAEQIANAGVVVAEVRGGSLARHITVPGTIIPSANNTARVAVKTTGTVAELRKGLGDRVGKGEIVALLDSREIADAKSEYLAARVSSELQRTLFEREQALWDRRVSSEQQYLRARAATEDLRVKLEAAQRKLTFLGLGPDEIDALPALPAAQFERQEIRSPIAGKIVERRVDLGAAVGRDSLETELYSVVNLAQVWVELAVTPGDLPLVREGQKVTVFTPATGDRAEGRIIFIGPVLDRDTRSARVVAELQNPDEIWRPGSYVSAEIAIPDQPVHALVPATAVQKIEGRQTVFVRVEDGFEARPVDLGRYDDRQFEVRSGLAPSETIVVENSFVLKAELLKTQAED